MRVLGTAPRVLGAALRYMMGTFRGIHRSRPLEDARQAFPQENEKIMTIAEELREEGRKAGRRFGTVSEDIRRRWAASASEIEIWLHGALGAPTSDAVFAAPRRC